MDALLHIFISSTGDFSTDNYTLDERERVIWLFFIITTYMTTIIFFNMLINIMGLTLDRLEESKERISTQQRIEIYSDFVFLRNPSWFKPHHNLKYLYIFKPYEQS